MTNTLYKSSTYRMDTRDSPTKSENQPSHQFDHFLQNGRSMSPIPLAPLQSREGQATSYSALLNPSLLDEKLSIKGTHFKKNLSMKTQELERSSKDQEHNNKHTFHMNSSPDTADGSIHYEYSYSKKNSKHQPSSKDHKHEIVSKENYFSQTNQHQPDNIQARVTSDKRLRSYTDAKHFHDFSYSSPIDPSQEKAITYKSQRDNTSISKKNNDGSGIAMHRLVPDERKTRLRTDDSRNAICVCQASRHMVRVKFELDEFRHELDCEKSKIEHEKYHITIKNDELQSQQKELEYKMEMNEKRSNDLDDVERKLKKHSSELSVNWKLYHEKLQDLTAKVEEGAILESKYKKRLKECDDKNGKLEEQQKAVMDIRIELDAHKKQLEQQKNMMEDDLRKLNQEKQIIAGKQAKYESLMREFSNASSKLAKEKAYFDGKVQQHAETMKKERDECRLLREKISAQKDRADSFLSEQQAMKKQMEEQRLHLEKNQRAFALEVQEFEKNNISIHNEMEAQQRYNKEEKETIEDDKKRFENDKVEQLQIFENEKQKFVEWQENERQSLEDEWKNFELQRSQFHSNFQNRMMEFEREMDTKRRDFETEIDSIKQKIESEKKENQKIQASSVELKEMYEQQLSEIIKRESRMEEKESFLNQKQAELQKSMDDIKEHLNSLECRENDLNSRQENCTKQMIQIEKIRDELNKKEQSLHEELEQLAHQQSQIEINAQQLAEKERKLNSLEFHLESLNDEKNLIEIERNSFEGQKSQHEFLMNQKLAEIDSQKRMLQQTQEKFDQWEKAIRAKDEELIVKEKLLNQKFTEHKTKGARVPFSVNAAPKSNAIRSPDVHTIINSSLSSSNIPRLPSGPTAKFKFRGTLSDADDDQFLEQKKTPRSHVAPSEAHLHKSPSYNFSGNGYAVDGQSQSSNVLHRAIPVQEPNYKLEDSEIAKSTISGDSANAGHFKSITNDTVNIDNQNTPCQPKAPVPNSSTVNRNQIQRRLIKLISADESVESQSNSESKLKTVSHVITNLFENNDFANSDVWGNGRNVCEKSINSIITAPSNDASNYAPMEIGPPAGLHSEQSNMEVPLIAPNRANSQSNLASHQYQLTHQSEMSEYFKPPLKVVGVSKSLDLKEFNRTAAIPSIPNSQKMTRSTDDLSLSPSERIRQSDNAFQTSKTLPKSFKKFGIPQHQEHFSTRSRSHDTLHHETTKRVLSYNIYNRSTLESDIDKLSSQDDMISKHSSQFKDMHDQLNNFYKGNSSSPFELQDNSFRLQSRLPDSNEHSTRLTAISHTSAFDNPDEQSRNLMTSIRPGDYYDNGSLQYSSVSEFNQLGNALSGLNSDINKGF